MGDLAQNYNMEVGGFFYVEKKKVSKKYFLAKKYRVFPYKTWAQSSESV